MQETLFGIATVIIPMIIAIVFHEVAHGWTARALGDPTAAELNRLSLNPLRHVDPIGTILLPGFLKLVGAPVIGWAKPVPVNQRRLRNPRYGMMAVAAAGPASNLLLGLIGAVALGLLLRPYGSYEALSGPANFIAANLFNFLMINIFLALFNMLPIPPFDGSHIVEGLLPRSAAKAYGRFRPYGFPLIVILLIAMPQLIPGFDPIGTVVMPPVQWLSDHYMRLALLVAGK